MDLSRNGRAGSAQAGGIAHINAWRHLPVARLVPGFGEMMRLESLKKTPMAPLSRAQAATRGAALIVNLPGSVSGATENLQAVLHLIPHALELLSGDTRHE